MGRSITRLVLILLVALLLFDGWAWAIKIDVVGSWSPTIDATDLQVGAGSDLNNSYESASNAVIVDIFQTGVAWRVDVKRVDTFWHADLVLWVKRTGDGSSPNSGGTEYIEVTAIDQAFFTGVDDSRDIPLQLKLSGVSISVPPNSYSTTIYYTAVETG